MLAIHALDDASRPGVAQGAHWRMECIGGGVAERTV
jgi:hypothetical protein